MSGIQAKILSVTILIFLCASIQLNVEATCTVSQKQGAQFQDDLLMAHVVRNR